MIIRVSMEFPADSALPRDHVSIHPHFSGSDPDALLAALKANLQAWPGVAAQPFILKAYDAEKPPPSYPIARAEQTGNPPASSHPREVALCLSYYSTWNRPRYRGRLYLPSLWTLGTVGVRPSTTQMDAALSFGANVLRKQLPAATNWVVYSPRNAQAYGVTNAWVDDEWDTVRSRGLRSTARQQVTY